MLLLDSGIPYYCTPNYQRTLLGLLFTPCTGDRFAFRFFEGGSISSSGGVVGPCITCGSKIETSILTLSLMQVHAFAVRPISTQESNAKLVLSAQLNPKLYPE